MILWNASLRRFNKLPHRRKKIEVWNAILNKASALNANRVKVVVWMRTHRTRNHRLKPYHRISSVPISFFRRYKIRRFALVCNDFRYCCILLLDTRVSWPCLSLILSKISRQQLFTWTIIQDYGSGWNRAVKWRSCGAS